MTAVVLTGLRVALADVSSSLSAGADLPADLAHLTHAAVAAVGGWEYASFTMADAGPPWTPAASAPPARALDQLQYDAGQGPCLDALREHVAVVTGDLEHDQRWPRLTDLPVAGTGVRSVLSLPLPTGTAVLGALNISSSHADAFDDEGEREAAHVFAHYATAVVAAGSRPAPQDSDAHGGQERRALQALAGGLADLTRGELQLRLANGASGAADDAARAFDRLADHLQAQQSTVDQLAQDLGAPVRNGLTVLSESADLLAARRGALDDAGRAALDLLRAELDWHRALTLQLLQLPDLLRGAEAVRLPNR